MQTVYEDTRQQADKHDAKHAAFEAMGVRVVRTKLAHGDYAIPPAIAVDTKASIYELAMDIDREHERFRRECVEARDDGTLLVVLVENEDGIRSVAELASWNEPKSHFAMRRRQSRNANARPISGARLAKACATMYKRYGVRFMFCEPQKSARFVASLLGLKGDGDG